MIGNHGIKTYTHVNVRLAMGKTIVLANTFSVSVGRRIGIKSRVKECGPNKFVSKDIQNPMQSS